MSARLRRIARHCAALALAAIWAAGSPGTEAAEAMQPPRLKPPPPPPSAVLSREDYRKVAEAVGHVRAGRFGEARNAALDIVDEAGRDLALWFYIDGADPNLDFETARDFIDRRPDWPSGVKFQRLAERAMPEDLPGSEIFHFFETRAPLTGEGKRALARAYLANEDRETAARWARSAWIDHDWSSAQEKTLLSDFDGLLTPEDHAARVDRLLWGNRRTAARRMLPLLEADERRAAQARMNLLRRRRDAGEEFNSLPDEIRSRPAMIFEAARYMRRSGEEEAGRALLLRAPGGAGDRGDADAWWNEREYVARRALKSGAYQDAYGLVSRHGYAEGVPFAHAEWMAGWIALRFLDDPLRAAEHFEAMESRISSPISVARAAYWQGRAAEAAGLLDAAEEAYRRAAEHNYAYYGQLAALKLSLDATLDGRGASATAEPTQLELARFEARDEIRVLHILGELEEKNAFRRFAYHIDDSLSEPVEFALLNRIARDYGVEDAGIRASKTAYRRRQLIPELAYPVIDVPESAGRYAESALILGLSRQESEFNPQARSYAGARGLMQLIPETARVTARGIGERYRNDWLTTDPEYNMMVGSAHFRDLLNRFDGSYVLSLAGYNAGPARPPRWVRDYGDPRKGERDPVDWVELVPFSETRDYIQRVLENTQIYRARLISGEAPILLVDDLMRGSEAPSYDAFSPLPAATAPGAQSTAPAQLEPTLDRH